MGTAFAFTEESGLDTDVKNALLDKAVAGTGEVFTDPLASPTGFPFKVALLEGSYSDGEVSEKRERVCDLGYLREPYWRCLPGSVTYCSIKQKEDNVVIGFVRNISARKQ